MRLPLRFAVLAVAALPVCLASVDAAAQTCTPPPDREAAAVTTRDGTAPVRLTWPEPHVQVIGPGWLLFVEPQPKGWRVTLRDGANPDDARDLTSVTPPFGSGPNPRDLLGWQFRNAANTGPNTGDVNAPQATRNLWFSTALAGTGGYRPPDPNAPALLPADPDDGHITLNIVDFELTPPEPGSVAGMTAIAFEACVTWPRLPDLCLPDDPAWRPQAAFPPPVLTGDFDGDGRSDRAVQLQHAGDGTRAIGICLDTAPALLFTGHTRPLPQGLVGRIEAWSVMDRDHPPLPHVGAPPWPDPDGDVLALERIEKSLHLLYLRHGGWQVQEVYRMIEPDPADDLQ